MWPGENVSHNIWNKNRNATVFLVPLNKTTLHPQPLFKGWWHLVAFIDHCKHFYEIVSIHNMHITFYRTLDTITLALESLPQPFYNWKFNWRRWDLNPRPFKYQSNVLPTELSWPDSSIVCANGLIPCSRVIFFNQLLHQSNFCSMSIAISFLNP